MSDDSGLAEAFGYRPDQRLIADVFSVTVGEAMRSDTLQPRVSILFRFQPDQEQVGVLLPVELAEPFAEELVRWAKAARDKHFE